jgi:hypothetical protein
MALIKKLELDNGITAESAYYRIASIYINISDDRHVEATAHLNIYLDKSYATSNKPCLCVKTYQMPLFTLDNPQQQIYKYLSGLEEFKDASNA